MNDNELHSSRTVKASLDQVWRAHEDSALLAQWWGPDGFRNTFHSFEFKPGSISIFTMHGPDGTDYLNEWKYLEIVKPERIFAEHLSQPHFLLEITFTSVEGGTRIDWHTTFDTAQILDALRSRIVPANEQNFNRLEAVLATL
jgi:uncharacterized protein YndB with AHSA1/START domain